VIHVTDGTTASSLWPPTPDKSAAYFNKWNTDTGGSGSDLTKTSVITSDEHVFAIWGNTGKTLTTGYEDGSSENTPNTMSAMGVISPEPGTWSYATGSKVQVTAAPRAGYDFVAWYKDTSGTIATDDDGVDSIYTITSLSGNQDIYAGFKVHAYKVTFNLNAAGPAWGGGGSADKSVNADYNTTLGASLPAAPTWAGSATFAGWNTATDGTGDAFDGGTVVTKDITVYAKWTVYPQLAMSAASWDSNNLGKATWTAATLNGGACDSYTLVFYKRTGATTSTELGTKTGVTDTTCDFSSDIASAGGSGTFFYKITAIGGTDTRDSAPVASPDLTVGSVAVNTDGFTADPYASGSWILCTVIPTGKDLDAFSFAANDSVMITVTAGTTAIHWKLDGVDWTPDGGSGVVDPSETFTSQAVGAGTHTVSLVAVIGGNDYGASVTFTVSQ
jgi:uncharacterized repeat protein (TIGR02543 family)